MTGLTAADVDVDGVVVDTGVVPNVKPVVVEGLVVAVDDGAAAGVDENAGTKGAALALRVADGFDENALGVVVVVIVADVIDPNVLPVGADENAFDVGAGAAATIAFDDVDGR